MKHNDTRKAVIGTIVALVGVVGLAMVPPVLAGKPLNSGKDGFKSNAGAGNGTEDVQVGEPSTVTTYSSIYSENTTDSSGEPSIISVTTTSSELSREQVGEDVPLGKPNNPSPNFKRTYDVTYQVVTTTGTETVVTYETTRTTEVYKTDTTTTDMADVDPGNAQSVNQAPEGEPDDIVETSTVLDSTSSEVTSSSAVVYDETSSSSEQTTSEEVTCNPGNEFCNNL
jgi:hypothetical protein